MQATEFWYWQLCSGIHFEKRNAIFQLEAILMLSGYVTNGVGGLRKSVSR